MKTVSNRLLHDWLQATKVRGHDLRPLLRAAKIPWHCYENTRSHISGEQLACLSVEIRRLLNDQFMGHGQKILYPALLDQILIKILARSKNLGEMLCEWENFYNLVQDSVSIITSVDNNECVYRFQFTAPQRSGTHVWILDITMLKTQLFSWMIGKEIKLNAIGFAEPAPACAAEYCSLLPTRLFFSQAHNFFVIDKKYLRCPIIRTEEQCLRYKEYLPHDFFSIPKNDRCFTRLVERTMESMLKAECRLPKIDYVAEELSVSVRGLRRKLESEGESFQNLKDKIRCDLAVRQLACAQTPIGDVAAYLGFSGAGEFSRAFKVWTDSTPQEYRHHLSALHE